jgi:hypothetical protein
MSSISTTSPTLCAFITFINSLTLLISLPPKRVMVPPTGSPPGRLGRFASRDPVSSEHHVSICHDMAIRMDHDAGSDPFDRMYVHICVLYELDVAHLTTLGITFSTAATIVSSKLAICITSPGKVKCASRCCAFRTFSSRVIACRSGGSACRVSAHA